MQHSTTKTECRATATCRPERYHHLRKLVIRPHTNELALDILGKEYEAEDELVSPKLAVRQYDAQKGNGTLLNSNALASKPASTFCLGSFWRTRICEDCVCPDRRACLAGFYCGRCSAMPTRVDSSVTLHNNRGGDPFHSKHQEKVD